MGTRSTSAIIILLRLLLLLLMLHFLICLRIPAFLMAMLFIITIMLFQSCFELLRSIWIIILLRFRPFFRLLLSTFFSAERGRLPWVNETPDRHGFGRSRERLPRVNVSTSIHKRLRTKRPN